MDNLGKQKVCPQPCPSLDRLICFENQEIRGPEIGLIIEQRLNFVCKGTFFVKPPQGRRTTYTYMKLSQNKKTICYGDFAAKIHIPEMEDLTGKILISDIKDFGAGMISKKIKYNEKPVVLTIM